MKLSNCSCRNPCPSIEKCIFNVLEFYQREEIERHVVVNSYKKNQTIFLQGNTPSGVFCVNSGKVKIVILNTDGKESIVRLVNPGDIMGHRALFSDTSYNASAIALEDSVVCFFEKEFIFSIVKTYPAVAIKLLATLSQSMGVAEINGANLVHKNVRERVAGLLINLKNSYGIRDDNRIRLDIKLTREEMAAMVGTTHETLVRLFTEFKNEEMITQEGKVIFIVNEAKLVNFANI